MDKKRKIAVKPYQFKKPTKGISPHLDKDAKENLAIIVAIVFILGLSFVFTLRLSDEFEKSEKTSSHTSLTTHTVTDVQSGNTDISEEQPQAPEYLKKYTRRNPNTVGYIKIKGTKIDYPVVQANDNEYYITRGFNKNEDSAGAVFMDYRCDINDLAKTRNIVLYGHRMKDGSMFKGLLEYEDEAFFLSHQVISFDTINASLEWKVFAVFETTTDFYYIDTEFPYDEMWLNFLDECQELSMYDTYMNFYEDDIVLTLSTCTTEENGRFVVMAKLIQ